MFRYILAGCLIIFVFGLGLRFYYFNRSYEGKVLIEHTQTKSTPETATKPKNKKFSTPRKITLPVRRPTSSPRETNHNMPTDQRKRQPPSASKFQEAISKKESLSIFKDMEDDALVSFIRDPQSPDDARSQALSELLQRIGQDPDRENTLQNLTDVKDAVKGEDRQFIFKAFHQYADLGANDTILASVLDDDVEASSNDRARMLSYIDPAHPLTEESTDRLIEAYEYGQDRELHPSLLSTLAAAGGERGVTWIIDRLQAGVEEEGWPVMVGALADSGSPLAMDYLNESLNELALEGPEAESRREVLRQGIARLKKGLP